MKIAIYIYIYIYVPIHDIVLRSADIALRSDIAPAIETDYKKTTLTFSKVPTKR